MDESSVLFNLVISLIGLAVLFVFYSVLGVLIIRFCVKIFKRIWNSVD